MVKTEFLIVPGANAKVVDFDKIWEVATRDGVPDVVVMQAEIPRHGQFLRFSEHSTPTHAKPASFSILLLCLQVGFHLRRWRILLYWLSTRRNAVNFLVLSRN